MLILALVNFLLIVVEHYLPWQMMLGRELPRPAAYALGVLAIAGPLTIHLALRPAWFSWQAILALWIAVVSAGFATIACYALDAWLLARVRAREAAEREQSLIESLR